MAHKILIVVSNPATSTSTGWPVGFWASELIHPYDAFTKAGYEVTIASPDGGRVEFDAMSDPRDASGYSKDDTLSAEYIAKPGFMAQLKVTPAVASLGAAAFDAIVVAGGQGPMFTFPTHSALQSKFMEFHDAGKPSAALCHGTCLLLHLPDVEGVPFVSGKAMTGFTNGEEDFVDKSVGQKVMPFRIEDEASRRGARFQKAGAFEPYAVRDGLLITGQQQNSGGETAKLVIAALEGKSA